MRPSSSEAMVPGPWLAGLLALLAGSAVLAADPSPSEWLRKMAIAVERANYSGTVVRVHDGTVETLRVAHRYRDGEVSEKLESLDGAGREIIRSGDEVHCILPESRLVLVERQINQEGLFGRLPGDADSLAESYDLTIENYERVVGRPSVQLAIRPRDHYRFGHRLWLDRMTAIPLRRQVVGNDGSIVEEMRFAEITIGADIPSSAFQSSIDTDGFTWYRQSEGQTRALRRNDTGFEAADLPSGFRLVSSGLEAFPGIEGDVAHIVYSDGVATVSVFVEAPEDAAEQLQGAAQLGAAYAFGTTFEGRQVTVIGEVPGETVRMIAGSLRVVPGGE